jgi:hypothetical protein
MAAGEQLLTNVRHDGEFFEAGIAVPAEWDEALVDTLRESGAIGFPQLSPTEMAARMAELDAKLQEKTGLTLSEVLADPSADEELSDDEE